MNERIEKLKIEVKPSDIAKTIKRMTQALPGESIAVGLQAIFTTQLKETYEKEYHVTIGINEDATINNLRDSMNKIDKK